MTEVMEKVLADLPGRNGSEKIRLDADLPVEASKGVGLGHLVSLEEGKRRLGAYATSMRLEDWAGPVAGPTEIEKRFGTVMSRGMV